MEAMAYSQEAIQMNALSVSFLGTEDTTALVANSPKNIVIIFKTRRGIKCVLVRPPACGLATFSIKFKAQVYINGVVLFPGYESAASNFSAYQTNVAIKTIQSEVLKNYAEYWQTTTPGIAK